MAIDNENKRRVASGELPVADGTIGLGDRRYASEEYWIATVFNPAWASPFTFLLDDEVTR